MLREADEMWQMQYEAWLWFWRWRCVWNDRHVLVSAKSDLGLRNTDAHGD